MKTLKLGHVKPALARAIERKARQAGTSLDRAVILLLEEVTGLAKRGRQLTMTWTTCSGRGRPKRRPASTRLSGASGRSTPNFGAEPSLQGN